jgi:predicted TIM-barrel fold metal-dependent hydrolase
MTDYEPRANPDSYADHVGLWAGELAAWLPEAIFDAHVHLGPPEVMGPIHPERRSLPLATFTSLTWEELQDWYPRLFRGKQIAGTVVFPFPTREVDIDRANRYIIDAMHKSPAVKGFLVAHPTDGEVSRAIFAEALAQGVRFAGVKPYFDLLGKGVFECTMPEFIPEDLLRMMNDEGLVMMLHTSGRGMCDGVNQDYLRNVMQRFPRLRIVLAHMGRYLEVEQFHRFCDTDLLDYPALYLEMSSATLPEVYVRVLRLPHVRRRLLFGSDLPFGLITGVEAWSERTGPIFVTRDRYLWTDPHTQESSPVRPESLTYNTYHTIKAFKDGLESLGLAAAEVEAVKQAVFCGNAAALFASSGASE